MHNITYKVTENKSEGHAKPNNKWKVIRVLTVNGEVVSNTTVCEVPDYHENSLGVASGICQVLNENSQKVILPLIGNEHLKIVTEEEKANRIMELAKKW